TLPWALPAARHAGIPGVWTCMGWWFRPKRWQRAFFRRPAATFAHSQAIKRGFLGEPPFMPPEYIEVLYPGVDTERFSPRADGPGLRTEISVPDGVPLVAMIGRYQQVKGQDVFVRAMWGVLRRHPNAHFLMVGDNPDGGGGRAFRERVERLVESRPAARGRFHFLGHRADVERVMAAADVIVCPSHFESFGMVNVEAMATATPVVSTNEGGPREVIVDGVTGYLVPPNDPDAIAERVIELLFSAETRRRFGAAGRLRVRQQFSVRAVAGRFAEVAFPPDGADKD
ncbi:MAG: glycosyltransferase family 4 protein, partial [Chloroflexota bacterium]